MGNALKTKGQLAIELEDARKRAEEALKESESFNSSVLENAPNPIVVINTDASIRYINPACEKLTGFTLDEVAGRGVPHPWWPEEERKKISVSIKVSIASGGRRVERIFQKKNGERFWVELNMAPIMHNGTPKYYLSNWVDITERRRVEESLAASENDKKIILNAISDIVVFYQDSSLAINWANEAAARSVGKSPQDLVGRQCYQLWYERNKPCDDCPVVRALETKLSVTGSIKTPDGRSWEVSGEPVYGSDGKMIGAIEIAHDITERRRVEESLRESEEKFSKAFHSSPDAIAITSIKDDKFIEVNDSFTRITGYTREEVISHCVFDINTWVSTEERDRIVREIDEQGRVHNVERALRTKSGEIRSTLYSAEPINIGGEPCLISVATDITELKRAEEALANEAIRRRILIEQSSDGIVILDESGKVYEANRRFAEMLGYSSEEVLQLYVWDWDTQWTHEQLLDMLRSVSEAGDHFETYHRRKDGTIYDVEISTNGATFAGQKLVFCVCRDITERKRAEEKIKQALSNLEHSNVQLAATNKEMEAFSYSVSHDLRAPLRSIDGFSQALLEDYMDKLDEKGQDYLGRLRAASQKMGELIDGLLKLSRLTRSEMHKKKVDLSMLAQEIMTNLQQIQPERQVECVISRGLTARGDHQLLRSLLENLLGNAWKFTGKRQQARIEFGATRNGDKEAYFVRDNGAGFDMNYAGKLFGAFQRLHDTTEFPGTGIGLATVQRIIHRHGGSVWAEGAVGEGATFYFTLS